MNLKEFKSLLSESDNVSWFNSEEFNIELPAISKNLNFKGIASFHRFLNQQITGWGKLESELPKELKESLDYFKVHERALVAFVQNYSSADNNTLKIRHNQIKNSLSNNKNIFTYDSLESFFLLKIHNEIPKKFKGVYMYFTEEQNSSLNNKDVFDGYLLAYEFKSKDYSEILKRKNAEKASISKLRNDFEESLSEWDAQLVEHLAESTKKYEKFGEELTDFKTDKEKTYSDWFINTKGGFEKFSSDSNTKITELEETYKEKLKLSEPAEYWSKRATSLRKQGWWSLGVLAVLVLIVVWSLGELLWKTPEQIYSSFFNGDKSAAIRWSIIYVTFISFMAFAIRAITKVMFSSFHLARDSEERHTLTYFYLSLLKDSNVEKEERQLIMQSLFSRAETGLLKDDSTPAMPNDMIGKVYGSGK